MLSVKPALVEPMKRRRKKKEGLQPGDAHIIKRSRLKKHPPLTKQQQQLVEEHMWIAKRLAYQARSITGGHTGCFTEDDLRSVASFALCVAATRFDPDLGWKFSTFAWSTVRGYIQHALRDFSRMVRIPRWIPGIREEVRELASKNYSFEEIGEMLDLDERQVIMCEESWNEIHISYDHTPDESRPREFTYEIDEAKTFVGQEVLKQIGTLPDSDIQLLLLHVEGEIESPEEQERAEALLSGLREILRG